MTVCIGAICDGGSVVAWGADTKISLGYMSADFPMARGGAVNQHWIALFSGNDISQADPFLRRVVEALEQRNVKAEMDVGVDTLMEVFRETYREHLQGQIERVVLNPYGVTVKEFMRSGRKYFGASGA